LIEKSKDFVYKTGVRFNAIYVLESLCPGELKTGQDLFDLVIYPAASQLESLHATLVPISTKTELLRELTLIEHAAQIANHYPVIHIEAHGSPDGIVLADDTHVAWSELIPAFSAINVACKNNLIVIAISCYGWNLTASLIPSDRAPVFMLVGPPEPMTAGALLNATQRFYKAFMSLFDVNQALEAMNAGLKFSEWPIRPATSEILYCRVFRHYMDELGSGDALKDRENRLVADIAKSRSLNVLQSAALRLEVRRDLADHRAAYDRYREKFLMLDLFPQDVARFGLTYDLCMPPG
jgi:hypothetical protein